MFTRAFAAWVPAAWVVGETIYGGDEVRHWLEAHGRHYALAVPCTHGIWRASAVQKATRCRGS